MLIYEGVYSVAHLIVCGLLFGNLKETVPNTTTPYIYTTAFERRHIPVIEAKLELPYMEVNYTRSELITCVSYVNPIM